MRSRHLILHNTATFDGSAVVACAANAEKVFTCGLYDGTLMVPTSCMSDKCSVSSFGFFCTRLVLFSDMGTVHVASHCISWHLCEQERSGTMYSCQSKRFAEVRFGAAPLILKSTAFDLLQGPGTDCISVQIPEDMQ